MRTPVKIFLLIAFMLCFSCEEQGFIVKCPECLAEEPLNTDLTVKLESGFSSNLVHVDIYEGNLEDSILYDSFILTGDVIKATVTLNKDYTVTATYTANDGTTYVAVDAVTPRVKYEKDQCDDPCFFVYDKTLDLRLKYTR